MNLQLTNTMQQSLSWEAENLSVTQKIPWLF